MPASQPNVEPTPSVHPKYSNQTPLCNRSPKITTAYNVIKLYKFDHVRDKEYHSTQNKHTRVNGVYSKTICGIDEVLLEEIN